MNFVKESADTKNTRNAKKSSEKKPAKSVSKGKNEVRRNKALLSAITPSGIEFMPNKFYLGENLCRIYGIYKYAPEVSPKWLSRLTSIPGTIVSISLVPIDGGEFSQNMSNTVSEKRAAAESTKDQLTRSRMLKAAEDAEKIMKSIEINQDGGGASGIGVEIMVLSRDEEDFEEKCSRIESTANAQGCRVRIISMEQKEAYMHLSPTYPQQETIKRKIIRPMLLHSFTGGYPYTESGFCDPTGYYLGKNSSGGIILFDPWIRTDIRTNSNMTIVGGSGTGKSTSIKHIIHSEIARGTKILIIDLEGEYKEICLSKLIDGKWIDVAGGRGGVINPLQIRPAPRDDDEAELSNVSDMAIHLKTLQMFFSLYLPSITHVQKALLERSLIQLYENFGINWYTNINDLKNTDFPTIGDLYELIKNIPFDDNNKSDYETLSLLLESAAKGADRGLWNGHTTIDSDSRCICLDTKAVATIGGSVLAAQYFNILSWCWQEISKNQTERIMLIADECWSLIDPKCPQSLEFLRNAEKRARKYEGSIVVATQEIADFLDSQVKLYGQAVLDLPTIKFIFGTDGQSLTELVETFNLNEEQKTILAQRRKGTALMTAGSQKTKVQFSFSEERLAMFGKGGGR